MKINHKFVEFIPKSEEMEYGVLYISVRYKTSSHLCMCGCGEVVVTPIKPNRWKLTFDGKTISLSPSVGNCSLSCRSHYWIEYNEVIFLDKFSEHECEEEKFYEKLALKNNYKKSKKKKIIKLWYRIFKKRK